jgi:hypothetical protein
MKDHPNRFWCTVLALGWLFDVLFWKQGLGVNFALYVGLCTAAGFILLRLDGLRPARAGLWLVLPLFFYAVVTFVRSEPLTALLAGFSALALMGVLAATYHSGGWNHYGAVDYVVQAARLAGSMIGWPLKFPRALRRSSTAGGVRPPAPRWKPILRGVLIALPVVAVFATLLASADLVFALRWRGFLSFFRLEDLPEYIFRLVLMLAAAYALAGAFMHAALRSDAESARTHSDPTVAPFLGSTEASVVLASVATLFAFFVVIQFQYFFGGRANVVLQGFTYAEYARRGFFELVTVALFSLILLMLLSAVTKREGERERRVFSWLEVSLVVLVLVILMSAYQRLALYENAYGFSRLRAYTHVALVWIGLLLVTTMVLELARRKGAFALAALVGAAGFTASLALINVDSFVVTRNVGRELAAHPPEGSVDLDSHYLVRLSDDAVPALARAYVVAHAGTAAKDELGAVLACEALTRRTPTDWQSFHLASFRATSILRKLAPELSVYRPMREDQPRAVRTPLGKEFACAPGSPD